MLSMKEKYKNTELVYLLTNCPHVLALSILRFLYINTRLWDRIWLWSTNEFEFLAKVHF